MLSVCLSVPLSVLPCYHNNSDISLWISSKFHTCFPIINISDKFEDGFCPTNRFQDGQQNGRQQYVLPCYHNNFDISQRILSKFHTCFSVINISDEFEDGFCPINRFQDGRQNGRQSMRFASLPQ